MLVYIIFNQKLQIPSQNTQGYTLAYLSCLLSVFHTSRIRCHKYRATWLTFSSPKGLYKCFKRRLGEAQQLERKQIDHNKEQLIKQL